MYTTVKMLFSTFKNPLCYQSEGVHMFENGHCLMFARINQGLLE